ncbi:hypothetical protein BDV59DRAFT_86817 [Aspergillus ambiguus]|uniref:uncharacterized protein n=1 Tax=Aspergillus ambiguus TaxID=176160 RepID=UPI003CCDEF1B
MIRFKPTAIILGPDDLMFHLQRFRYNYARSSPRHTEDSLPTDEEDEDGHDDAFLDPDSLYYLSPSSSNIDCSSESDPDLPPTRQRHDCGEERTDHPSPEARKTEDISVHRLVDANLLPVFWKTTLNTTYKSPGNSLTTPDNHPSSHPLTSLYQPHPPPSDFLLPFFFSARILFQDCCCENPQHLEDTRLSQRSLEPISPGASTCTHSLFTQPICPPLRSLQLSDKMAASGWTPVNLEQISGARNSHRYNTRRSIAANTLASESPSSFQGAHSQDCRDKLVNGLSSSSGANSVESCAASRTPANMHNTSHHVHFLPENVKPVNEDNTGNVWSARCTPHGSHCGSKKHSRWTDPFLAPSFSVSR